MIANFSVSREDDHHSLLIPGDDIIRLSEYLFLCPKIGHPIILLSEDLSQKSYKKVHFIISRISIGEEGYCCVLASL